MRFKIKKLSDFINEGAYIDSNNNVVVSKKNHPADETEKLKTSDLQVFGSNKRYVEGSSGQHIEVYYGLYPEGDWTNEIPERYWVKGKDENGNVITLNTIKSRYMDSLKSGNFNMSSGETLGDFINSDVKRKFPSGLDYIVTIESSKSLVPLMGEELKMIYPNAKIIELSKNIYKDPSEIFDIEKAEKASEKEPKGKSIVLVRAAIKARFKEWEKLTAEEKEKGYKISTSNKIKNNIRQFLRSKYNLKSDSLKNAIYDCLVIEPGSNSSKNMIILDDNTNTGKDFGEIAKGIKSFVDNEIRPLTEDKPEYKIVDIQKNILGYVFYLMPDVKKDSETTKINRAKAKELEKDINFTYETYRKIYADRGIEGLELTNKAINSTVKDLEIKKGIASTPDEIAKVIGIIIY